MSAFNTACLLALESLTFSTLNGEPCHVGAPFLMEDATCVRVHHQTWGLALITVTDEGQDVLVPMAWPEVEERRLVEATREAICAQIRILREGATEAVNNPKAWRLEREIAEQTLAETAHLV